MDLHKSRSLLVGALVFLAGGTFILVRGLMPPTAVQIALGSVSVIMGVLLSLAWRKPLRLRRIGADGLSVHVGRVRRVIGWDEVGALIIDQSTPVLQSRTSTRPYLLLVPIDPASCAGLALDKHSPLDNRPCALLLELEDVRESPQQIVEALAQHVGDRFTDMRVLRAQRFDKPKFTIVLRGYDTAAVDEIVQQGRNALATGNSLQRHGMRARVEAAKIPTATRGYDRAQVDATFAVLSAELATWPDHDR